MNWGSSGSLQWLWMALGLVAIYIVFEAVKRNQLKHFADSALLPQMTSSLSRPRRLLTVTVRPGGKQPWRSAR